MLQAVVRNDDVAGSPGEQQLRRSDAVAPHCDRNAGQTMDQYRFVAAFRGRAFIVENVRDLV